MRRLLLIFTLALAPCALALTPQERAVVTHARSELRAGQKQYKAATAHAADADAHAASSDKRAEEAEKHAGETDLKAAGLQKQVDEAYEREKKLASETNTLRDLKKQVYSHWGLGGILLGFSILVKHIFILVIVIAVVAAALFALSFFFPVIGVGLRVASAVLKRGLRAAGGVLARLRDRLRRGSPET